MVDTIIYRIRRPNGSYVDEPVDLPASVSKAVSALMRMHGGATAIPVDVALASYGDGGNVRLTQRTDASPGEDRRRFYVAATAAAMGVAVLCGAFLGRAFRSTVEQVS